MTTTTLDALSAGLYSPQDETFGLRLDPADLVDPAGLGDDNAGPDLVIMDRVILWTLLASLGGFWWIVITIIGGIIGSW